MARFKAFLEGRLEGEPPRAFKLRKRAGEVTVGIDGQYTGVSIHASVDETEHDQFRVYATYGTPGAQPVYLGQIRFAHGRLRFITHTPTEETL